MKNIINNLDAFKALEDIEDVDISSYLGESKTFSIRSAQEMQEAEDFINQKNKEVSLEVIDPDADALEHLKNNEDYIGQAIVQCRTCLATHFENMDELVEDENEQGVYNVEVECPHCHKTGTGFTLVGQVGKVAEEEPKIENDSLTDGEARFENDVEPEPEQPAEEEAAEPEAEEAAADAEEEIEFSEEEKDGDETPLADDTEETEDTYGEEVKDKEDFEYDDTEEKPEESEENTEEEKKNVLTVHNDEEEEKKEKKESLNEDIQIEDVKLNDFISLMSDPENIETSVFDYDSENPEEFIYHGSFAEMPYPFLDSTLVGFNVGGGHFTIYVDTESENTDNKWTVRNVLDLCEDDFFDNLSVWDVDADEELYFGTVDTARDEFGNLVVHHLDTPLYLELKCRDINVPEDLKTEFKENLDYSDPEDKLISDIIFENDLLERKVNNEGTNEYWIARSIRDKEDLDVIYNEFVDRKSESLKREFKDVTGYMDKYDLALENNPVEPVDEEPEQPEPQPDVREVVAAEADKALHSGENPFAVIYGYQKHGKFYSIKPFIVVSDKQAYPDKAEIVRLRYKPTGSIYTLFQDNATVTETINVNSRKELTEAIKECQNNNQPYSIKSLGKGKYNVIIETLKEEEIEPETAINDEEVVEDEVVPELSAKEKIFKFVDATIQAIADNYPVTISDKKALFADFLKDIDLLPEDVEELDDEAFAQLTYDELVEKFNALDDELVEKAVEKIDASEYEPEVLDAAVKAEEFADALKAGKIPGITFNEEEPVEAEEEIEKPENEPTEETVEIESDEEVDFDESLFENFINNYLDENLEETVLFETISGNINSKGDIRLNGQLITESGDHPIEFTLKHNEELNEGKEDVTVYDVTSNLAEDDILHFEMKK